MIRLFHQLRRDLAALLTVVLLFLHSGPPWLAEVALQHQPPAAEPAPADEGGGRRGCQGQRGRVSVVLIAYNFEYVSEIKQQQQL